MKDSAKKFEFVLNEKEILNYEFWFKTIDKKFSKLPVEFIFRIGNLGTTITAVHGKVKKDITDYNSW